jgi:predicted nuclease with TOPRIM domain
MSDKRFTINLDDECIDDAKEEIFIDFNDRIDFPELCDLLNNLYDGGEELKEKVELFRDRIKELQDANSKLLERNYELEKEKYGLLKVI